MTALAFILGCVPLWTASGAGSVARQIHLAQAGMPVLVNDVALRYYSVLCRGTLPANVARIVRFSAALSAILILALSVACTTSFAKNSKSIAKGQSFEELARQFSSLERQEPRNSRNHTLDHAVGCPVVLLWTTWWQRFRPGTY
jgi:hypothetical protein